MTFLNRTAVVTGAGGGIGRAVCKLLYRHGVQIAACDITGEAAQKCVDELSPVPGVKAKAYTIVHKGYTISFLCYFVSSFST